MRITDKQATLFESVDQRELLSQLGNPLEALDKHIDWDKFRERIASVFPIQEEKLGGRPRKDVIMMFKVLILQQLYNLSDRQAEFQVADRSSFRVFLGIKSISEIPDEKTIWKYRDDLTKSNLIKQLFEDFHERLGQMGLLVNKGKTVDATIISVQKQRNTKEENEKIKNGEEIEDWKEEKRRQKDVDARWVKKHGKSSYGYKDHIIIDNKSKLIDRYEVGAASEHDSKKLEALLSDKDKGQTLYADSAYRGKEQEKLIKQKEMKSRTNYKGYRNKALKKSQIKSNKSRSKIRARVEHVFGHIKKGLSGFEIRSIGIERAKTQIGLKNLAYNMKRSILLVSKFTKVKVI